MKKIQRKTIFSKRLSNGNTGSISVKHKNKQANDILKLSNSKTIFPAPHQLNPFYISARIYIDDGLAWQFF